MEYLSLGLSVAALVVMLILYMRGPW